MNVGILFSGGKDSAYAAYLAKEHGHNISCFITLISQNPSSYMFHTPNIEQVEKQANAASIPLIVQHTKGEKEKELIDLKIAIEKAAEKYEIQGIITGAVESAYQASRVQKICNELGLDCFNPLWQKDQFELLDDLIRDKFDVIITGVFAYPLDKSWLGRKIDNNFLKDIKELNEKYMISPAGEGGEIETFVLNCPL
ncbi:MAG: diphthine--ammonia ligase, partial [Candidatus Thermoplasmatota archaeon]|nr:diphthine--ammonia ligase [Candidatus Thermoplasmatota archaeon]